MDISRMIKRATSDVKYILITLMMGIAILFDILSLIDIISYGADFVSFITPLIAIIADISLLLYALGSHGTKGSKITLYAYFGLNVLSMLIAQLLTKYYGVVPTVSFTGWISLVIMLGMMAFIFFGIRGFIVYGATAAIGVIHIIDVFKIMASVGFFGLLPLISLLMPTIVLLIAGYLVATSAK